MYPPSNIRKLFLAHFIRINAGDSIHTQPNATSELYYIISGLGTTEVNVQTISWKKGDFLTLPSGSVSRHIAAEDSTIYYILDTPLLNYLGVKATEARFKPTLYTAEEAKAKLDEVANAPDAHLKNRILILLNNQNFEQTLTLHTFYGLCLVLFLQAQAKLLTVINQLHLTLLPCCTWDIYISWR